VLVCQIAKGVPRVWIKYCNRSGCFPWNQIVRFPYTHFVCPADVIVCFPCNLDIKRSAELEKVRLLLLHPLFQIASYGSAPIDALILGGYSYKHLLPLRCTSRLILAGQCTQSCKNHPQTSSNCKDQPGQKTQFPAKPPSNPGLPPMTSTASPH
jgi:hypothetical protein